MLLCLLDGRVTAPAWPETVAPIMEGLFVVRTEHLVHSLLHDAVDHVGNAEPALATICFWDPDAPDFSDAVASVEQTLMKHRQTAVEVLAHDFDRLPVRAWSPAIRGHFAKRRSQVGFIRYLLHRHRRQSVALSLY